MPKKRYGLIGKNIGYSFSKNYFTERFVQENWTDCSYENFDIQEISEFSKLIKDNPDLAGLNITIPYKESVIPFLDKLSKKARKIGAANVVRFTKKGELKGYNSDCYGFKKALKPLLKPHHKKALILGTGGASKAIAFALEELDITSTFVSRKESSETFTYEEINKNTFDEHQIIINCTPVGTFPHIEEFPPVPYLFFSEKHIAFDLIYNPEETQFLKRAKENGAQTKNGYEMLVFQAEKSWKIWHK